MSILFAFIFLFVFPLISILISEFSFIFSLLGIALFIYSLKIGTLGTWRLTISDNIYISGHVEALVLLIILSIICIKYYNFFRNFIKNRSFAYSQLIEISKFSRDAKKVFNMILAKKYGINLPVSPTDKLLEHDILIRENSASFAKLKNSLDKTNKELLILFFSISHIEDLIEDKQLNDAIELIELRSRIASKYPESSFMLLILIIQKIRALLLLKEFNKAKAATIYIKQISSFLEKKVESWIECLESFEKKQIDKMLGISYNNDLTETIKEALNLNLINKEGIKFIYHHSIKLNIYSLAIKCIGKMDGWEMINILDEQAHKSLFNHLLKIRIFYHMGVSYKDEELKVIETENENLNLLRVLSLLKIKNSSIIVDLFDEKVSKLFKKWKCTKCNAFSEKEQIFCHKCNIFNMNLIKGVDFNEKESLFDAMSGLFSLA